MVYIFLDESGDLSFSGLKGNSKFFFITCIICENKRELEKCVKKVFRSLSKAEVRRHNGVLHCFKESDRVRQRLLRLLSNMNVSIIYIGLNKKHANYGQGLSKQQIYNKLTAEPGLQATDFCSWVIYRKYEQREDFYYNLIRSKVKIGKILK